MRLLLPPLVVLAAASLFAWPFARHVFIQLGWVRATWWTTGLSLVPFHRDRAGGRAFAAAWALHRQPIAAPADVQWVQRALRDAGTSGATVAGHGLVAAARGDAAEARTLLGAIRLFDPRGVDAVVLTRAIDWLVAEAAARGDWSAVAHHCTCPRASLAARVLGAIAGRQLGAPGAVSDAELQLLRDNLPVEQRPPSSLLATPRARPEPMDPTAYDPVNAALVAHIRLQRCPTADTLAEASQSWEAALAALSTAVPVRAAELGAPSPARALPLLRKQVEASLAALAEAHDLPLTAFGQDDVAAAAAHQRREGLISAVEVAAEALCHRIRAGRWLEPLDEVREWLALARLYDEGVRVGGEDVRRVTFRVVYEPVCAQSVMLHNERQETRLSNAITRWLFLRAKEARDQSAVELQSRNLRI